MNNCLLMSITTILSLLLSTTINAATIFVDGSDGAIDNSDGVCSISEAIINANNNAATHTDCSAGSSIDTINLTVDITLTTVIDNDTGVNGKGRTGTPPVTSLIIIDGQGHILQRDNTLTCNLNNVADVGEFRLLRNVVTGLTLQNITLAHGCADSTSTNPLGRTGGGLYNDGDLTIRKVTFDQNQSNSFGGGLYHETGTILEISDSTFSGNSVSGDGGAIYKESGRITIIKNSTFSGNSATGSAGGIYNFSQTITLITNCTFSGNSSNDFATIANFANILAIRNSLFHNNVGGDCFGAQFIIKDNNISTNLSSCTNSSTLLTASTIGPLADNGGATFTHALLTGSEAIDGGGISATTTDQRGFGLNGIRDIGAYEAQVPVVTAPADIMMEATGATTTVTLGTAAVTDVDEAGVIAVADLSSLFAVGVHTVTWTATDSQGHVGTDTQTVTISDTTAPTITPPMDISTEATGATTSVTLGTASASDLVDGNVSPVTADNTGPFAVGVHSITWSATDAAGNTGTATQIITIIDSTAPIVTAPMDITIEATGATTPVTLGSATATDLVDGSIIPTANMSSPFAVGIHNITWSATDNAGNTGTSIQIVNVQAVISGTINGLNGTVTLQNNGLDNLSLNANGGFRFVTPLDDLSMYAATVLTQPATQGCIISNASGQINGSSVSDIVVNCTDNTLALDANSLDYGIVFTGDSSTQMVTLTNTGSGDVTISSFTLPNSPFAIIGGSCLATPITLMVGQSCDFIIEFTPVSEGNFTDSFDVISNTATSPATINLLGSSAVRIIPTLDFYGLLLMIVLFMGFAYYRKSTQ